MDSIYLFFFTNWKTYSIITIKMKKGGTIVKKTISFFLTIALLFTLAIPAFADSKEYYEGLEKGKEEAKENYDSPYLLMLSSMVGGTFWGVGGGLLGAGASLILEPEMDFYAKEELNNSEKSFDYTTGYKEGWKKGAQKKNLLYAGLGAVAGILIHSMY